jgi:hypothetical protein
MMQMQPCALGKPLDTDAARISDKARTADAVRVSLEAAPWR